MSALKSQNHSSLSSYAPPSEPLVGFNDDDSSLGVDDIFSMCSLICFIPWRSFLVIPGSSASEDNNSDDGAEESPGDSSRKQEFHKISTEDSRHELSKLSISEEASPACQSVPAWKQKYIARKSFLDEDSSGSSSSSCIDSTPRGSSKRTSLEETLDRCRNIEAEATTSIAPTLNDPNAEENEVSSSSESSWASFFSLGAHHSSSMSPVSLYSKIAENSDTENVDISLNGAHLSPSLPLSQSSSSDRHAYDSISCADGVDARGKVVRVHRRQHSPSGIMDLSE
jgi:hypothetical protein